MESGQSGAWRLLDAAGYPARMDIALTYATSLAALRAARREPDLALLPTVVTACPDTCPKLDAIDKVISSLVPLVGELTVARKLEVSISLQTRRPRDPRILAHVMRHGVPNGSYLELVRATDGEIRPFAGDGLRILVEGPALSLVHEAAPLLSSPDRWLAVDKVIALGNELCGTFARDPTDPRGGDITYGLEPLATRDEVSAMLDSMTMVRGLPVARRAIAHVADGCASAMEVLHLMMEGLPPRLAGLSLGTPAMNRRIVPTKRQRSALTIKDGLRPDLYWERYRVAIEHDGKGTHLTEHGWKSDHERVQDYQVLGIKVFTATYDDVRSVTNLNAFAEKLCCAIADSGNPHVGARVRRLVASPVFRGRQRLLLAYLLPPVKDLE